MLATYHALTDPVGAALDLYPAATGSRTELQVDPSFVRKWIRFRAPLKTDRHVRFNLPDKLYGRTLQRETIANALDAARAGKRAAVAVLGPAGIGKTALINEFRRVLSDNGGFLATGKFEQLRRTEPYAPILQAIRSLVAIVLTESEQGVAAWKQRLQNALDSHGALMTDAIPELQTILGPQPPIPAIPPPEARRRFLNALVALIHAFHAPERPLALFLDDLQWADPASLELVEALLVEEHTGTATLLLSWRSNEVDETHALTSILARTPEGTLERIELTPLDAHDIAEMLVDAMSLERERAAELARLLFTKTGGSPFFVRELLKTLYEQGVLHIDADLGRFTLDVGKLQRVAVTENVVELISRRLRELPTETLDLLRMASCMGSRVDLGVLALATRRKPTKILGALWPAIAVGILVTTDETARVDSTVTQTIGDEEEDASVFDGTLHFAHDRVLEAAHETLSVDERRRTHFQIGRTLLQDSANGALEEKVFEVLGQLNRALDLLADPVERRRVAELNLLAGRKAAASAAFGVARMYLEAGISLLEADAWTTTYDLAMALHLGAGEVSLAFSDRDFAKAHVDTARDNARSVVDRVEAQDLRIRNHLSRYETKEAIDLTLQALGWLGVEIPTQPTLAHVIGELGVVWWRLRGMELEALRALPEAKSKEIALAMRLLVRSSAAAFYASSYLLPIFFLRNVRLSLEHGVTKFSAVGFSGYAILLMTRFNDVAGAKRMSTLAHDTMERFDAQEIAPRINYQYYSFIDVHVSPIGRAIEAYRRIIQQAIEVGDFESAALAGFGYANRSFLGGVELDEVDERCRIQVEAMRKSGQLRNMNITLLLRQLVANLRGQTPDPAVLEGEHIQPASFLRTLAAANDKSIIALYHYKQCMVGFLFDKLDLAVKHADLGDSFLSAVKGSPQLGLFNMYCALARATRARRQPREARKLLRAAKRSVEEIRKWSDHAPMNFLHHQHLAEAAIAETEGRDGEAAALYEKAINGARAADATHEAALGLELAARFYFARGRRRCVGPYLAEARAAWTQWGALARLPVLAKLEREFSLASNSVSRTPATSSDEPLNDAELNLQSLMKASRAVSGELVLRKLSERLMRVVLENAGARRGLLVITQNGQLSIVARGQFRDGEVEVEVPQTPESIAAMPKNDGHAQKLLHYVARRREPLVSDGEGGRRLQDIADGSVVPRSVLCLPLVKGAELIGILYLENDLASGVFTASRMEVIGVLTSQATLSIQNAILYGKLEEHSRDLERKVQARTHDLTAKNAELADTLRELRETQAQFVMQQRLAALGSLTAGIAHEINNPVNSIQNFAELSRGIAGELAELIEAQSAGIDPDVGDEVKELVGMLRGNMEAIERNSKRAARIIEGMTAHASDVTGGPREATSIDVFVAETLKHAVTRAQAKHQGFQVTVVENYGASGCNVEISAKDMNRVFTNLVDNAWYAMRMKRAGSGYTPRLEVRTTCTTREVEVHILDNGVGIASAIADKICNPFFTTKPPNEGTGFGLSIAHEIVTRGHRGRLRFDSVEGEFAEFVLSLPRAKQTEN